MADRTENLPAWCDIQRNIGAVHIMLGLHGLRGGEAAAVSTNRKVRILPGKVVATSKNDTLGCGEVDSCDAKDSVCVQLPGVKVIPESCNGLCVIQGRELHIRFQLQKHDGDEECTGLVRKEQQQLRHGAHTVCCRTCGNTVLCDKIQFKRVLELPTENWQELAKDWCCHANSLPNMAMGPLKPIPGDCLVGDHYVLLHPSSMEPNSVAITLEPNSPGVKCTRCRSTLGDAMIEEQANLDELGCNNITAVQINKHSICVTGETLFRSYSMEGFISRSLLSRTRGAINFKFLIQGPSKHKTVKTFVLLWLLNPAATIVTNVESWFPDDFCYLSESDTSSNTARPLQVLKVLYKMCSQDTVTEQQEWQNNSAVQLVTLSTELCLQLLVILTANTCTLPSTARTMDGFQVGYLRM